jgi:hypothetical protein
VERAAIVVLDDGGGQLGQRVGHSAATGIHQRQQLARCGRPREVVVRDDELPPGARPHQGRDRLDDGRVVLDVGPRRHRQRRSKPRQSLGVGARPSSPVGGGPQRDQHRRSAGLQASASLLAAVDGLARVEIEAGLDQIEGTLRAIELGSPRQRLGTVRHGDQQRSLREVQHRRRF